MIGKFHPDEPTVATVFVARERRSYWRRDPESNRADRICNPAYKPRKRAKLLESLGKPPFMEGMGYAVSIQSGSFLPDGPANGLKARCARYAG